MRTLGLLGGMSWESTIPYYRLVNEAVTARLGGLHSAKLVLHSVDFHEIEQMQREGRWREAGLLLGVAARGLESAGAQALVLCTNTMHKVATDIEAATTIPLLHITDPTAEAIKRAGFGTVGLLGTRFTMEETFYRDRLERQHGLRVLVPQLEEREAVNRVIYEELCAGKILTKSREQFQEVMAALVAAGAQGIILGCTEISLLVSEADASVRLFDTTAIHAQAAAEWSLQAH
jgi:aspartate racemase